MALNTKINIPIDTLATTPNINNLSDEANKVNSLANKLNRSNSGQNNFTSASSGRVYNTTNYPNEPTIFNKGETGLYNLFVKLYGGENGWMIMAEDWNSINTELSNLDSKINTVNTTLTGKINTNTKGIDTNKSDIATLNGKMNTAQSDITGIKEGTITVGKASNATNANYATSAGSATSATNATNANYATTAGHANDAYTQTQSDSRYQYKVLYGTGSPSGGSNGDLYIQY